MNASQREENLLISVIVVHYHLEKKLLTCLKSLQKQHWLNLEILVINTGVSPLVIPSDLSCSLQVHTIPNQGYAQALNHASTLASGDYFLLLNSDTELLADTITKLLETAKDYPKAILNPKTLDTHGNVDSLGNQMHYTGITSRLTDIQPRLDTRICDLPVLSGAAIFLTREVFVALHGFDPDYFMYFEDTDFSIRAKLLGFELLGCYDCTVVHDSAFALSAEKFFFLERNRLLLLCKIYQTTTLIKILPALVLTALITFGFACTKGITYIKAWFRVLGWYMSHRTWLLEKRRAYQALRSAPDQIFLALSTTHLPFEALTKKSTAKVLTTLTTPFYQLFRWFI
jgi:GT2 family glycosyltransferase